MNGFIDLHTHILPGVDDGAPNMTEALELLHTAWDDGTRAVFLTPHYRGKFKKNTPEMLRQRFEQLREMTQRELPEMELYLGQEMYYELEAPEAVLKGQILRMNDSDYVLLELRIKGLRSMVTTAVSEVTRCGYTPIIAHAERYEILRKDPKLIDELLDMGALIQLNASSILGKRGFGVKWFCHKLLKQQKAHFVASDAHDMENRLPLLRECFLRVHKKYGTEYAARLFCENACAVIENQIIE